jgi:type IV pilus assembly protein PilV
MFRHNAVILVGDVADRIRANPTAGAAYAAVGGVDNGCVGQGNNCSQPQMAAHDIFLWAQQAAETLPAGAVNVVFDGGVTPPTYAITANWTEAGENLSYGIVIPVRNN